MTVFTRTWDAAYEAVPADSDQISEGALRIRQTRTDVQERGEVDHSWAGDVDDGLHLKVTFVDPLGAKPTQADDQTYLYTKDVSGTSELFFEDEAGNEIQLTGGGETFDDALFPAGTKCPFYQVAAPAGGFWVIDDTVTDHMMRVVNTAAGTGGSTGGSDSPILMDVVPSHTHPFTTGSSGSHTHGAYRKASDTGQSRTVIQEVAIDTGSTDSGNFNVITTNGSTIFILDAQGAHTHTGTSDANGSAANWTPQYADFIICTRQ